MFPPQAVERSAPLISIDDWVSQLTTFGFQGQQYTTLGQSQEQPSTLFPSLVQLAYKTDSVVFACMLVRQMLFKEARFQWRNPAGDLFGTPDLAILERPWPGGTTSDLLARTIMYSDIGGNAFIARRGDGLTLLRPDWVDIIVGSHTDASVGAWDVDARAVGYAYYPGGKHSGTQRVVFSTAEVAHFAPIPDPLAQFRGMSWLTPVIREIMADKAATDHKLAFFENGAVPSMTVKFDVSDIEKYRMFTEKFREDHEGSRNAYKTLFLAAGMDATVVGKDFQQIDFKVTQGAGETRVAAAARTPPVLVGLSEGLQGSSLNEGNYGMARRSFADGCLRPLWADVAGSLESILPVPAGAELWYDDRKISFVKEDLKDSAEIQGLEATTIRTLTDGGFVPASVIDAVTSGDWSRLKHTDLFSVQLQAPGTVSGGNGSLAPGKPVDKALPAAQNGGRTDPELLGLLMGLASQRSEPPINIRLPDITIEPARIEAGAVQVHLPAIEAPKAPDVNVTFPDITIEPARIEAGAVQVNLPAIEAPKAPDVNVTSPDVNVTFEMPKPPSGRQRVKLSDGAEATVVTEGDNKRVEFDDGRVATVEPE